MDEDVEVVVLHDVVVAVEMDEDVEVVVLHDVVVAVEMDEDVEVVVLHDVVVAVEMDEDVEVVVLHDVVVAVEMDEDVGLVVIAVVFNDVRASKDGSNNNGSNGGEIAKSFVIIGTIFVIESVIAGTGITNWLTEADFSWVFKCCLYLAGILKFRPV